MIDLLQSIAILFMGIAAIVNSVRIKNLTESVRCPHIHPTNDLRCRREAGHGGQHRAVNESAGLHHIWPITPN